MTYEEAIAKFDTGWWKDATPEEIVEFQLYEERLCMPFSDFHAAVERVMGRPVFTHEFASKNLVEDYERIKRGEPSHGPDFSILEGKNVLPIQVDEQENPEASGMTMGGQSQ